MTTKSKYFRSRIDGRLLPRTMSRYDPRFNAWIQEVALDVSYREYETEAVKIANRVGTFRSRDGRFWSLAAEIKSRPWELVPFDFVVDWFQS